MMLCRVCIDAYYVDKSSRSDSFSFTSGDINSPSAALLHSRANNSPPRSPERGTGRSSGGAQHTFKLQRQGSGSSQMNHPQMTENNNNNNSRQTQNKVRDRLRNHLSNANPQPSPSQHNSTHAHLDSTRFSSPTTNRHSMIASSSAQGPHSPTQQTPSKQRTTAGASTASKSQTNAQTATVASAAPTQSNVAETQPQQPQQSSTDPRQAEVVKDVMTNVVGAFKRVSVLLKDKPAGLKSPPQGAAASVADSDSGSDDEEQLSPSKQHLHTSSQHSHGYTPNSSHLTGSLASSSTSLHGGSSHVSQAIQEIAQEHQELQEAAATDIKSLIKKAMKKKAPQVYTFDKDSLLQNTLAAFNRKVIMANCSLL